MNARRKLNGAAAAGIGLVALLVGVGAQSWWAFAAALVVLAALAWYVGLLRPFGRDGQP